MGWVIIGGRLIMKWGIYRKTEHLQNNISNSITVKERNTLEDEFPSS